MGSSGHRGPVEGRVRSRHRRRMALTHCLMRGERDGAAHQGASVVTGKGHRDAATSQGMLGAVGNSRNQGEALDSAPEPSRTS